MPHTYYAYRLRSTLKQDAVLHAHSRMYTFSSFADQCSYSLRCISMSGIYIAMCSKLMIDLMPRKTAVVQQ
jgi:hypothetical protein